MLDGRGEALLAQGVPEGGGVDAENGDADEGFDAFGDLAEAQVGAALHDGVKAIGGGGEEFEDGAFLGPIGDVGDVLGIGAGKADGGDDVVAEVVEKGGGVVVAGFVEGSEQADAAGVVTTKRGMDGIVPGGPGET